MNLKSIQLSRRRTALFFVHSGSHLSTVSALWNPSTAPFLAGRRFNKYFFKVELSQWALKRSTSYLRILGHSAKGPLLFVGSKDSHRHGVALSAFGSAASRLFVGARSLDRWAGGSLTNASIVRTLPSDELHSNYPVQLALHMSAARKMADCYGRAVAKGPQARRPKESFGFLILKIQRILSAFELGGPWRQRGHSSLPSSLFHLDCLSKITPLREAKRLDIPSLGFLSATSNPFSLVYGIPFNATSLYSLSFLFSWIKSS